MKLWPSVRIEKGRYEKGNGSEKERETPDTQGWRVQPLSEIQSLSTNILTGIPGELFHIRVSLDYYRPLRNIPFSAPHKTSRHKFDFSQPSEHSERNYADKESDR